MTMPQQQHMSTSDRLCHINDLCHDLVFLLNEVKKEYEGAAAAGSQLTIPDSTNCPPKSC